jgi:hypothetical protein
MDIGNHSEIMALKKLRENNLDLLEEILKKF